MSSWESDLATWDGRTVAGYDPHKHYTAASDRRGHNIPIKLSAPPILAGLLERIVQSGVIEKYRTRQDIIRDAVVHHLHCLGLRLNDEEITRDINMHTLNDEAVQRRKDDDTFEQMMTNIRYNIEAMQTRAEIEELREYLEGLYSHALDIRARYRVRFVALLEEKAKAIGGITL